MAPKSGLVVIGAGLPRTGTTSTKTALEVLLGGHCYHMKSLIGGNGGDREHWLKAMQNQIQKNEKILSDQDWIAFLEERDCKAGVDYPISMFYK